MSRTLRTGFYIAAALVTLGAAPALAQSRQPEEQPKPAETRRPPATQPTERPTLNRRPQQEPPKQAPKPAPAPAPPKEQAMVDQREGVAAV